MYECRCYQHTCTEVFAGEEDGRRYLHPFDFLGHHREATSWNMSAGYVDKIKSDDIIPKMEAARTRTIIEIAVNITFTLPLFISRDFVCGLTQANDVNRQVVLALRLAATTLGLCLGVHAERILIEQEPKKEKLEEF